MRKYGFTWGGLRKTFKDGMHFETIKVLKEEVMPKDDIKGHWAEVEIRGMLKKGIMTGYPDGSFKPGKNITRVEIAVIISRVLKRFSL